MGLYVILMGVQGAGKGMQASYIKETYHIPHVSTGDLFRAMRTREDDLARKVQAIMAAGQLVSDDVTNEIVADRLSQEDAKNGVILDGYPRNANQADFLAQLLAKKGEQVNAVLLLKLDLFIAFKRAFGRVTDEDGASYNIYYNKDGLDISFAEDPSGTYPPRLQVKKDGKILKRRPDDANAAAVIKRIDTYLDDTQPLIEYYKAQGIVFEIDADQSIAAVNQAINSVLDRVK